MLYINARFFSQDVTGVQRFAIELSKSLAKKREDVVFLAPHDVNMRSIDGTFTVKIIGKHTGHLWEQYDLPRYLRSIGSPLILNLCNMAPIFYRNKIITLHDVAYKRFPQSYSFQFRQVYNFIIPRLIQRSRAIFTVSEFAKVELSHFFGISKKQLHVIYNAASDIFHPDIISNPGLSGEKYFLTVASQQYHKNFEGLISAFLQFPNDENVKLKIVGSQHKNYQGVESIRAAADSAPNVQFLGRVDDNKLAELYRGALAFVFPSFYEGFGIPPIEAQASGCPVIASSSAAMPEVLGNSVIYFDPYDRNSLVDALTLAVGSESERQKLIDTGLINSSRFSWDKSATDVSNIIDNLLKNA